MAFGCALEKIDACLAQGNGYFHVYVSKSQLVGRRQEIRNNADSPNPLICVFYFAFHIFSSHFAKTQLR